MQAGNGSAHGEIDAAARSFLGCTRELNKALDHWEGAGKVLRRREWWLGCHLQLPSTKSSALAALQNSTTGGASLAALSIVHVALQSALLSHNVRACRKSSLAAQALLQPAPSAASPVARALQEGGEAELAEHVRSAVKTLAEAQEASQVAEEAALEAATTALSCAHTAAALVAPAGIEGAEQALGLGGDTVEERPMDHMARSWWMAFPQSRRETRASREGVLAGENEGQQPAEEAPALARRRLPSALAPPREGHGSQPTEGTQRRVRFMDEASDSPELEDGT